MGSSSTVSDSRAVHAVDPWEAPPEAHRAAYRRWLPALGVAVALAICGGLLALASTLTADVDALSSRIAGIASVERVAGAVAIVALALLPALPLLRLRGRQRRVDAALNAAGQALRAGDGSGAVRILRAAELAGADALGAFAGGLDAALAESGRRWQAAAELSAEWLWETDRQGCLAWLSAPVPGVPDDALIGRRHDQVAAFDAPAAGWTTLHACMARLEPFDDLEFRVRTPQGVRWFAIDGRPRRDAAGTLLGYEGVGRDVTEWRVAHERLVDSEQRWSMMTRLAADWYWQTDAEHRLLPLSAEQQQRFGAALAERIEGRTRWDAHPDALPPEQWAEHRADLDARRPFRSLQLEIEAGDGRWLWISLSGMPRFDAAGRFVGYHGVGRDVTARKEAERLLLRHNEALQRAVDERTRDLQQMNRDLDAFARQLAHELRTPIAHVLGLAQLLGDRAAARLAANERELLGLQVQAAQRMRETVDALLALARSTLQPMPQQPVDLSRLVREVADELPATDEGTTLRVEVQPGMRAMGNPAALKIVVANLLGNAAKFTRASATPCARVALRDDGEGRVRVSVADNGVGFDPQRAGELFQPFSRLHPRDGYAGSGIGLSIVQRIVERHGGTVAASATPGAGACFEFTLPAIPPDNAASRRSLRPAAAVADALSA